MRRDEVLSLTYTRARALSLINNDDDAKKIKKQKKFRTKLNYNSLTRSYIIIINERLYQRYRDRGYIFYSRYNISSYHAVSVQYTIRETLDII